MTIVVLFYANVIMLDYVPANPITEKFCFFSEHHYRVFYFLDPMAYIPDQYLQKISESNRVDRIFFKTE